MAELTVPSILESVSVERLGPLVASVPFEEKNSHVATTSPHKSYELLDNTSNQRLLVTNNYKALTPLN